MAAAKAACAWQERLPEETDHHRGWLNWGIPAD